MAHHVVNLLRGEHGVRLHLRHGAPQSHIVGRGGEPRNLRLVHTLSAILDVRLRLVLAGRRKARDDGAHGGAAVLHSVVVHQHYPCPYAVLAPFKLDETILHNALREALKSLPEPYAMLFSLHYEEELTIPQIAQITDLPEGTVKSRLHKTMNIIKQQLKQYENR